MKKMLKTIKNFFLKTFRFFDKWIVTPISKFVLSITVLFVCCKVFFCNNWVGVDS